MTFELRKYPNEFSRRIIDAIACHGYNMAFFLEDPDRYTVSVNGYGHMEHPVNRNADIQGMNRYFGWYEKNIQAIQPWIEDLETRFPDYKLMLTEYGADANIAHQTEYIEESLDWTKAFYPETFQTKTHEYQWPSPNGAAARKNGRRDGAATAL